MNTNENMEWEKEAPKLAALPRITPYRVPENYFNQLESQILSTVKLNEITANSNPGFQVPSNYFENLSDLINTRIALEKYKSNEIKGFTTPPDYFKNLQNVILDKTVNKSDAPKVVKFWNNDFIRYAVAACFILVVASGLYVNKQFDTTQQRNVELASEQILYNIDESLIIEHLADSKQTASQSEIESYILDHYSSTDISNNL